uniref:enoyl-CoA hydratase-related protein n=2 Tax=Nocardia TaxID=1817 RepID=UPI002456ABE3
MSNTDSATEAPAAGRFSAVKDGKILRITITNPKRKNALSYDTLVALGDTFLGVAQDKSVRAVVISGEAGDFSTGADLSSSAEEAARGITPDQIMDAANRLVRAVVD